MLLDDSAGAFGNLLNGHQRELLVHCYRMVGTIDEAEDAVQEAFARAWQGRRTFRRSVSFRAWLYRIATNVCLNAIAARKRNPVDPGFAVGPCPDDLLRVIAAPEPGPEARYDAQESVSLAFLTVLQVLPPRQRAVLILRDVLTLRAAEVAVVLDMTVPAVNSALQRARATLRGNYGLPALSSARLEPSALLDRYVRAWEAADVVELVALLRDDAVLAMPPKPMVIGARQIGDFLAGSIFANARMRLLATHANGGPAFGAYVQRVAGSPSAVFALLVIGVDDRRIARIDAFSDPRVFARFDLPLKLTD